MILEFTEINIGLDHVTVMLSNLWLHYMDSGVRCWDISKCSIRLISIPRTDRHHKVFIFPISIL